MTRREEMIKLLKERSMALSELASFFEMTPKDVARDLAHVDRTIRRSGNRFYQQPAQCLSCEYIFKNRKRFTKPHKCPKCYSTYIEEAKFKIEDN
ncbi:MAG: transcriptional regulator [Candidatus Hodarchaeales archaeon]|jgi:predicted Zn-ribbon and HTH transcriptional regulator